MLKEDAKGYRTGSMILWYVFVVMIHLYTVPASQFGSSLSEAPYSPQTTASKNVADNLAIDSYKEESREKNVSQYPKFIMAPSRQIQNLEDEHFLVNSRKLSVQRFQTSRIRIKDRKKPATKNTHHIRHLDPWNINIDENKLARSKWIIITSMKYVYGTIGLAVWVTSVILHDWPADK